MTQKALEKGGPADLRLGKGIPSMKAWWPFLLVLLAFPPLGADVPEPVHVAIPRLQSPPSMARDADLSTWKGALVVKDFAMMMPDDKGVNSWETRAHVGWGPDALYVAFEALDPDPSQVRAARHKRDDSSGDLDFVAVDIDASGKGQSAIRVLATPLGGQIDSLISDSLPENFNYDCLWDSVGVLTPSGYVVKIRIPYSSLRRRPGEWGLRLMRIMPRKRLYGIVWPRMSRDIQCDICQMAKVSGAPLEQPGSPFLVIPSVASTRTQTTDSNPVAPTETRTRLGMDLRYATTSMTLEGTYRPDFNAVDADVDPLQINSRFKVLYPEKRPFFLEGMDLLGATGAQHQFFSRYIAEPLYGIKSSGQSSFASWTLLNAKDLSGGSILGTLGASGVDAYPTRDTAAAARFQLDSQGSGISVLGTDKLSLGGPGRTGGQSGGIYLDQYLGTEFHVSASGISSTSHLPQEDGQLLSQQGKATALQLDWNTRNWVASLSTQGTSPDFVLVSGLVDLAGYRRENASFGWQNMWNEGALSQAAVSVRARNLEWWGGDTFDRAVGMDASLETPGRWSASLNWDIAGRTWANDGVHSAASRALTLTLQWRRFTAAMVRLSAGQSRTIDLESGLPAQLRTLSLSSSGVISALAYSLSATQAELDQESGGQRLSRAREAVASATWQFPHSLYVKTFAYAVRYDGSEADSVDKFLKVLAGWQPNAFTNAYLGWSGQRRRDPAANILMERMVERGLFVKFAYSIQF